MKLKKSYRIEEELVTELEEYARENGISAAEAIGIAIRSVRQSGQSCPTNDEACRTKCRTSDEADNSGDKTLEFLSDQLSTLQSQLEVKDRQISDLNARLSETMQALTSAQRAIEQSHMLHAADKKDDLLLGDGRTAGGKSIDDVRRMGLLEFIRWKRRG